MRFLRLLASLSLVHWSVGDTRDHRDMEKYWRDVEDSCRDINTNTLYHQCSLFCIQMVAANNWCNERQYAGKCCRACKAAQAAWDPACHDVAESCAYNLDRYPGFCAQGSEDRENCKKTCRLC